MDFYLFSLILGFVGLGIMAFSGLTSNHGTDGGHGGHAHGHGHAGHGHAGHGHHVGDVSLGHGGHGHAPALHAGHGAAHAGHGAHAPAGPNVHHGPVAHDTGHGVHDAAHADHGDTSEHGVAHGIAAFGLSLLSPRVLFSILVGLGLTGMVAREWLGGLVLALVAVAGGLALEKAFVSPLWKFFMGFASRPARTLDSALFDTATAVTGFDAAGNGLVSIELDGQVVQLLGTLRPEDRASGVRVRSGDTLLIEEVDGQRNRCVVSWAGAGAPLPGR